MTRNIRLFIEDILIAFSKLENKTKDLTYEQFCSDGWFLDAVVNNFHIIGEAVKNVPDPIKAKYPKVPWKAMAGMRDILSHQYYTARADILWKTIKERIPQIRPVLEKILKELDPR
jgi:uncharacterized protein with HEPN domain